MNNDPAQRITFASLANGATFRLPHGSVIFVRRASNLADVLPCLRMHPEAPRAGFMHPTLSTAVVPVSEEELARLGFSNPYSATGGEGATQPGPSAVELQPDGSVSLLFPTLASRSHYLTILAPALDPEHRHPLHCSLADGRIELRFHLTDLKDALAIRIQVT